MADQIVISPATVWLFDKAAGVLRAACKMLNKRKEQKLTDAEIGRKLGTIVEEASKVATFAAAAILDEQADRRWSPRLSLTIIRESARIEEILATIRGDGFDWNKPILGTLADDAPAPAVTSEEEAFAMRAIEEYRRHVEGSEMQPAEAIVAAVSAALPAAPRIETDAKGRPVDLDEYVTSAIEMYRDDVTEGHAHETALSRALAVAARRLRALPQPRDDA